MSFKDHTLTFESDKIVDTDYNNMEVMMDWEHDIMKKSAEYVCQSKGDILEIGFGMGICSDYMQSHGVNSHTIVELHPQIIEKLKIWAADKPNVTIVEGDWWTVKDSLATYDGIFLDTFLDDSWENFNTFVSEKAKSGAKITYWNNYADSHNQHNFSNISFEDINVLPPSNDYFDANVYSMPKVVN